VFPLKNPSPDFETFREVLVDRKEPERVHFIEIGIDDEVMTFLSERMTGETIPSLSRTSEEKARLFREGKEVPSLLEEEKPYWKSVIDFYYRMGYDCLIVWFPLALFSTKSRIADDTATLSRGKRSWVEEKEGVVTSWETFEDFPFERISPKPNDLLSFLEENLPDGMKIIFGGALYDLVGQRFMGWECMFRSLFVEPDLVKAIFDKWGQIVQERYKEAISYKCVGATLQSDDLAYKKGTMVSPDTLRRLVFPWFKKYAALAHNNGKLFLCHSCGNVYQVMEDLIRDVKIDGFHSFQDVIVPTWDFKKRYGDRVAALGGVDVDKLARYDQNSLRRYVRKILRNCMPGGRYALGSGNTVTNFVPPENYLIMLEEGLRWRPRK